MANSKLRKFQYGFAETTTSGGTLVLTKLSKQRQVFNGSSSHTMDLPAANVMNKTGVNFIVVNSSTGSITVRNNGGTTLATVSSGGITEFFLTDASTANGVWRVISAGATAPGGAFSASPTSLKTANYTILSGDRGAVVPVDVSGGSVTITLPAPTADFVVTVKDATGFSSILNTIKIARSSASVQIDGAPNDDLIDEPFKAITYVSNGTNWFRVSSANVGMSLGLFGGGLTAVTTSNNTIDTIQIENAANATDFGDLSAARGAAGAAGSQINGYFMGGSTDSNPGSEVGFIEYVNFKTKGNVSSFGSLTITKDYGAGCSNRIRAVHAGAYKSATYNNTIDYIVMATGSNAIDFGDTTAGNATNGGLASPTRGIFAGGPFYGINYITINTAGNATNFGNLFLSRSNVAGSSNATRGLISGGNDGSTRNNIDYITIATTGNAQDFGDLTVARTGTAACANPIRSVVGGGNDGSTFYNVIDYVAFATLSNATDFGDLTVSRSWSAGCSNAHGGL